MRSQATAGHAPGALALDAVLSVARDDPLLPRTQQLQWSLLGGTGKTPDFFPNPRGDAALVDLDLAEADRRWQARLSTNIAGQTNWPASLSLVSAGSPADTAL